MQLYSGRSEWTLVVRRVSTPGIFCGQSHRQWNLRRVALGVPFGIPPVPRRFSGRIDLQPHAFTVRIYRPPNGPLRFRPNDGPLGAFSSLQAWQLLPISADRLTT